MTKNQHRVFMVATLLLLFFVLYAIPLTIWYGVYTNRVLSGFAGPMAGALLFDQSTLVYDDSGAQISEIHGGINRVPVPLDQIPDHVRQAFVAIEDERYYSHHGIDAKAVLRALVSYFKSGRITEGASTITQQVIKLYFLTPEQTLPRKIKEAALAFEFECHYTKDEILELYLNRVYFGEGAYGVQSASRVYFNKDSTQLTLTEGALLAALIQAPSAYNPYLNPEGSLRRRNVVLQKMVRQGFISEEQGSEASAADISLRDKKGGQKDFPYFMDYVIEEAIAAVGEEKLFRGGLKIHTTLEPEIQEKAEKVFEQNRLFPSEKVQAALALVENSTGAVKALVGGREHEARRGFNRATQGTRQPGSAFKPIAVYAPAFEMGYGPDSIISDTPFRAGNYEPRNHGGDFYGEIPIRTALQWSRNVAAVRLLERIGIERGYDMAVRMGFKLAKEDRCLPLALGGLTKGVSPLQMAGAYAAFANQGTYIKPYAIKTIEDPEGQILYRHPEGVPVMKTSTAEQMLDVLRTVVNSGTGALAGIQGIQVAGKTGTTELPDTPVFRGLSGNKDAWFAGVTTRYTAAVWMGYDEKDMDRQHYLTSYGGNQPATIFRLVMAGVLGLRDTPVRAPVKKVQKPSGIEDSTGVLERN